MPAAAIRAPVLPTGEPALLLIGYAAGFTYRPRIGEAAAQGTAKSAASGVRLRTDSTPGGVTRQGLELTQFELEVTSGGRKGAQWGRSRPSPPEQDGLA